MSFDRRSTVVFVLLLSIFFIAAGSVACGDSDETEGDGDAELLLEPETLVFSAELEAGESDEKELVISNAGAGDLAVSELEFGSNTDEAFEEGSGWFDEELVLEEGETHELSVLFEMPERRWIDAGQSDHR